MCVYEKSENGLISLNSVNLEERNFLNYIDSRESICLRFYNFSTHGSSVLHLKHFYTRDLRSPISD